MNTVWPHKMLRCPNFLSPLAEITIFLAKVVHDYMTYEPSLNLSRLAGVGITTTSCVGNKTAITLKH